MDKVEDLERKNHICKETATDEDISTSQTSLRETASADLTEILVYEKSGVIKPVEAPAINKVELLDL